MASVGAEAWAKYFQHSDVVTKLREETELYDVSKEPTGIVCPEGTEITVLRSPSYDSYPGPRGSVCVKVIWNKEEYLVPFAKVGKPKQARGPTEELRLKSHSLIDGGTRTHVDGIECRTFTRSHRIHTSIMHALKENPSVSNAIHRAMFIAIRTDFKRVQWNDTTNAHRNELGKYLGELIIGIHALRGELDFIPGRARAFHVPVDVRGCLIDSIIEDERGEFHNISSKYGDGAKAAFFSNLLPLGMRQRYSLSRPSVFAAMVDCAFEMGISVEELEDKKCGKNILYEFGVNHVLGLDIKKPYYSVYLPLREGIKGEQVKVVRAIKRYPGTRREILDALPLSVTSFFSRTIARLLNEDAASMADMTRLLASKSFWQVKLKDAQWRAGIVEFAAAKSDNVILDIRGGKAAFDDINAQQGTVTYSIKRAAGS